MCKQTLSISNNTVYMIFYVMIASVIKSKSVCSTPSHQWLYHGYIILLYRGSVYVRDGGITGGLDCRVLLIELTMECLELSTLKK